MWKSRGVLSGEGVPTNFTCYLQEDWTEGVSWGEKEGGGDSGSEHSSDTCVEGVETWTQGKLFVLTMGSIRICFTC